MNKNKITFNTENLDKNISSETDEIRLIRLAATANLGVHSSGVLEEAYFWLGGEPYEGMDPFVAYMEFKELLNKVHAGKKNINTHIDKFRSEGDVRLTLSSLHVEGSKEKPVVISDGSIAGMYDVEEALARDVANILSVHSSSHEIVARDGKTRIPVVDELKQKDCKASMMYYVKAREIRARFNYFGEANVQTREAFFSSFSVDLKSKQREATVMTLLWAMHHFSMTDNYHVNQSDYFQKFYNRCKTKYPHFNLGKDDQGRDIIPQTFGAVMFKKVKIDNIDQLWHIKILVSARLGGSKSSILTGHAWFDLPVNTLEVFQEAYDIVNLCTIYGFSCITLEDGTLSLAEILSRSGFAVVCPKLSKRRQGPTDKAGIFISTTHESLYWIGRKETPPMYKDNKILYDPYEDLERENSFCYSYITPYIEEESIYPSVRASDGLVIRHNCKKKVELKLNCDEIVVRFSMALMCKSQFIYCRVSFPQIDPMRNFFKASIVVPRLQQKKKKKDNIMTTLDQFEFLGKEEILTPDSALYKMCKDIPVDASVLDSSRPKSAVKPEEAQSVPPKKLLATKELVEASTKMDKGDLVHDFIMYLSTSQCSGKIIPFLVEGGMSRDNIISHVVSTWFVDVFSFNGGRLSIVDLSKLEKYRSYIQEKLPELLQKEEEANDDEDADDTLPPASYDLNSFEQINPSDM